MIEFGPRVRKPSTIVLAGSLFAAIVSASAQSGKPAMPVQVWEKPIAPGLVYRMEYDPNLPRTLNALRLSPQSPNLRWSTELAGGTINETGTVKGRSTPSAIAAQSGALASVNGDFFSYDHGAPIGQMVRNGELVTTPVRTRAVFGWGPKDIAVGMASAKGTLRLADGSELALDGLNQPVAASSLMLYTPAVGTASLGRDHLAVVLRAPDVVLSPSTEIVATVESLSTDSSRLSVEKDQFVLVATGGNVRSLAGLRPDDRVTIRFRTTGFDWERFDNQIGGGPFLLRDGKTYVDAVDQGFKADFIVRHPRTAVGRTADGDAWIVTVDGRQANSIGATLEEMAQIMRRLGCVDAINLDGGGSTALNVLGLTLNRPSDGVERAVSNGIVIFGPRPTAAVGALKLVLPPKVASDGTVQATVTLDGKPVDNADVLWTSRGAAWIDQGGTIHGIHTGKAKIMARVTGLAVEGSIVVSGPPVTDPKRISAADQ